MINIFPVIIVYNKSIKESVTLLQLANCNIPNENTIVVDNSTQDYGVEGFCSECGYKYLSMHGNKGLSKAYNQALTYLKPIAKSKDLVMWLDDDTNVTDDYFELLRKEAEKDDRHDIFMPIVIGQDSVIYSPNEGHFFRSKFMKSIHDEIDLRKINGINSCLAVRMRIYSDYYYSEDLFMDLTDNRFFDDMRKRNVNFCILRTPICQTFFQRGDKLDPQKLIARLRIKIKDFMVYANHKGKLYLFAGLIKCVGWGVALGKNAESPKVFLYCCFKGTKELFRNLFK